MSNRTQRHSIAHSHSCAPLEKAVARPLGRLEPLLAAALSLVTACATSLETNEPTCEPTDECQAPGETVLNAENCEVGYEVYSCTSECTLELAHGCGEGCKPAPPTSRHWDEERVCVPGGITLRGCEEPLADFTSVYCPYPTGEWQPMKISSFAIDKYPVTNRQWVECERAGACESILADNSAPGSIYPTWAATLSYEMLEEVCAWKGGRPPTGGEWQRAARGEAPDTRRFPWGDELDCEGGVPSGLDCDPLDPDVSRRSVLAWPGAISPFGAEAYGILWEFTSDWDGDEPFDPEVTLLDPQGPEEPYEEWHRSYGGYISDYPIMYCKDMQISDVRPLPSVAFRTDWGIAPTWERIGGRCVYDE